MSLSLRDRRVRVYGYVNVGGQGFISAEYVFRCERWASVAQTAGTKTIIGTAPEEHSDVVIDFDPSVDVRTNDLLVDGTDRYFARGITTQRTPPALLVKGEKLSTEVFAKLVTTGWTDPAGPTFDESVVES